MENNDTYRFTIKHDIGSEFIKRLIALNKAELILIIQSKDSKFYRLKEQEIEVSKSRVSLDQKTSLQLHIQALTDISFHDNQDLSQFYDQFKEDIKVNKFNLLAYSNVVTFDAPYQKPFDLFEKKLDEHMKKDIKIEVGQATINIYYRKPEYQFHTLPKSQYLNHPYIYIGLTKALQQFIMNNGEDGEVELKTVEPVSELENKLLDLMQSKMIDELTVDNIDDVIYEITDNIIEKYVRSVEEMVANGD
ncbi:MULTISPECIES: hypothetical protein [Halolactibacillus]|nr:MULTISPECIES: hypothetical protein [Halolactibacillus]